MPPNKTFQDLYGDHHERNMDALDRFMDAFPRPTRVDVAVACVSYFRDGLRALPAALQAGDMIASLRLNRPIDAEYFRRLFQPLDQHPVTLDQLVAHFQEHFTIDDCIYLEDAVPPMENRAKWLELRQFFAAHQLLCNFFAPLGAESKLPNHDDVKHYAFDLAFYGFNDHTDDAEVAWLEAKIALVDRAVDTWCAKMSQLAAGNPPQCKVIEEGKLVMAEVFGRLEEQVLRGG